MAQTPSAIDSICENVERSSRSTISQPGLGALVRDTVRSFDDEHAQSAHAIEISRMPDPTTRPTFSYGPCVATLIHMHKPNGAHARTESQPRPPFPKKKLEKPGLESELEPKPRYEAPAYKAAGKLAGKRALIT